MIKGMHHVAIAVSNLEESLALYERLLGVKPGPVEVFPDQQVRAAVFKVGEGTDIELIQATAPDSGIARFVEKRGEGLHHICLEVDDVDGALAGLAAQGVALIDRQGRGGMAGKVGFLHPRSTNGVLIELVQPGGGE